jgi:hypothetical protein
MPGRGIGRQVIGVVAILAAVLCQVGATPRSTSHLRLSPGSEGYDWDHMNEDNSSPKSAATAVYSTPGSTAVKEEARSCDAVYSTPGMINGEEAAIPYGEFMFAQGQARKGLASGRALDNETLDRGTLDFDAIYSTPGMLNCEGAVISTKYNVGELMTVSSRSPGSTQEGTKHSVTWRDSIILVEEKTDTNGPEAPGLEGIKVWSGAIQDDFIEPKDEARSDVGDSGTGVYISYGSPTEDKKAASERDARKDLDSTEEDFIVPSHEARPAVGDYSVAVYSDESISECEKVEPELIAMVEAGQTSGAKAVEMHVLR